MILISLLVSDFQIFAKAVPSRYRAVLGLMKGLPLHKSYKQIRSEERLQRIGKGTHIKVTKVTFCQFTRYNKRVCIIGKGMFICRDFF